MNNLVSILFENASTFKERNEIISLTESENVSMSNVMVANLYKSAIDKSHIDYDDIPDSKGDLTKYVGYSSMIKSLDIIKGLQSNLRNSDTKYVDTVYTAINNIILDKDNFERGFKLGKEFIINCYNTLVLACVESTSILIASYVDFIKRPDSVEMSIINNRTQPGGLCIDILARYNTTIKNGDMAKVFKYTLDSKEAEKFVGGFVIGAVGVVAAIGAVVIILRELIFYFYYNRMVVSDYLKQQAVFLEIHKNHTDLKNVSADKRAAITKKQVKLISNLNKLSDKVKVSSTTSKSKAINDLSNTNKQWKLDDVKSDATDNNGYSLL